MNKLLLLLLLSYFKSTKPWSPTLLRSAALKCWDRWAGACKCWANFVGICCVKMLLSFGRGFNQSKESSPGQTVAAYQHNISQHCWSNICKLRPNDRNISTQQIASLLSAICLATRDPVATCCDMLRVVHRLYSIRLNRGGWFVLKLVSLNILKHRVTSTG